MAESTLVEESATRLAGDASRSFRQPVSPRTRDLARTVGRARRFAERRHRGGLGRDGRPYFDHVEAVAALVDGAGGPGSLLCAAYLHDVVEHTATTIDEVFDRFGDRVAELVSWMTIPAHDESGSPLSWVAQKREALDRAGCGHGEVLWLKAADVCANIDALLEGYACSGPLVWERYEVAPARQLGYYEALADVLQPRLDSAILAAHVAARQRLLARLAADASIVPSFPRPVDAYDSWRRRLPARPA